jgi:hypothetical protein
MGLMVILKFAFFGALAIVGLFVICNIIFNLRRMKNREVQPVQRVEDLIDNSPIKDTKDLPDLTEIHRHLGISESYKENALEKVPMPDLSVEYKKVVVDAYIDPKYEFTDEGIILTFPKDNQPKLSNLQNVADEYSRILFEQDMIAYPRMFPEQGAVPWIIHFKFITQEFAGELELREVLSKESVYHKTLDNKEIFPVVTRDGDDLLFDIKNCPITQAQIEKSCARFSAVLNKNYTLVVKESPTVYRMKDQKPRSDRYFPFGQKIAGQFEKFKELIQKAVEVSKAKRTEIIFLGEIEDPRIGLVTQIFTAINDFVHGVIPGQTGSGKSTTLISLIYINAMIQKALNGYADLWLFADGKAGGDFDLPARHFSSYPVAVKAAGSDPMIELANLIHITWAEYERRQQLFKEAREQGKLVRNIFEYREQVGPLPRFWLVIDEFKAFLGDMDFEALVKVPGTIPNKLTRLLAESRSFGFTFIFASQRYQQDSFPTVIRSNLPTILAHKLQPSDQGVVGIEMPGDMEKGAYLIKLDGLTCPLTNVSHIKTRSPYIGSTQEFKTLLDKDFPRADDWEPTPFDYELIYNKGETEDMGKLPVPEKYRLIERLFIKEQGFVIKKKFTETHRVDTMDICAHLEHPEFPGGIGFGILEDKSELSAEIGKRNSRQLQQMNAGFYVFFLDFEIPGKDPIPLWKEEGLIPKNFCFIPSSQYLKPLKKAYADFELKNTNTWFYDLMQDLKHDFIQNETKIEESEAIMRELMQTSQAKTLVTKEPVKRVAKPRKKKEALPVVEPESAQIVTEEKPEKD